MNAKQLERASYLAAHAILSANISSTHLATPGARRSYLIDAIANKIQGVFELHCSALDETSDWQQPSRETVTDGSDDKLQFMMQKLHW